MTFIVSSVHTGSTHGIPGGAGVRRCVADNGGPHECPPQPFWTGVAMAPCLRPFSRRWTHSPYRFMQVPTNADFRSLSDVGTVLHERTLKSASPFLPPAGYPGSTGASAGVSPVGASGSCGAASAAPSCWWRAMSTVCAPFARGRQCGDVPSLFTGWCGWRGSCGWSRG